MDQQDYKVKYEKGKIHITYLLILAVILAVIGVSLAFGGNSEALGQISMASTVSSIILSAIAIFMSISGEYKLTYTHNKLLDTSERMSNITANIENANKLLEDTIKEKFIKIDDIFVRLEQIGKSVGNMENEVLNKSLSIYKNSSVDIPNDVIWKIYTDVLEDLDNKIEILVKSMMEYVVVYYSLNSSNIDANKLAKYVEPQMINEDMIDLGYALGVINVLRIIGIFKKDTLIYFEDKMDLSEKKRNEIKKYM